MALLVVMAGAACAGSTSTQVPAVHKIVIEGTHALSAGEIKDKILTAETGWWPFATRSPFDPADWQTDLRRIERLYETRGYYAARVVKSEVKPIEKGNLVDLVVRIDESQPVKVTEIDLRGLEPLPAEERRKTIDKLPVELGKIFREDDWNDTKTFVRRRLRAAGYASAHVDGHVLVDLGVGGAGLHLQALPGQKYHFGAIDVRLQEGDRVDPWWIEEQIKLAIGSDDTFSDDKLDEAQKRVFAMGVFSTARVATGRPDPTSQQIPIVAEVREGPMRTLRLGGGGAIDQVRQEVRLVTEWTHRNFLGNLRRLSLRGLVGWAFLPDVVTVLRNLDEGRQGPIYRTTADFEQPRLFGRPSLHGKALVESERTLEQTYNSIGGRALAGLTWNPRSYLTLFPSYNLQGNWLSGPGSNVAIAAPLALGCKQDPCLVLLSFLEQALTYDTRDNALEPRRGRYAALSLQEGGGPLGGDFTYLRVLPEARGYVTLGSEQRITFAGRLRFGTLVTASGRPEESAVVTRFYSGGALGMRGFATRRLSPMLLVPVPGASPPTDANGKPLPALPPPPDPNRIALPIGGNGLVEGSVESRLRVSENLFVAAFLDFGTVTRDRLPFGELPHMLYAVGLGLRYLTPVGPLRLDLGFRLPIGKPPPLYNSDGTEITYERDAAGNTHAGSEDGSNVAGGCFGIGARQNTWVTDGWCAFHLSIGEAY